MKIQFVSDLHLEFNENRLTADDFNAEHERCLAFLKRAVTESICGTGSVLGDG